jgi:nucleotide-binding universal stress UspA family protein
VVVGYDGSPQATQALRYAGTLVPGAEALVVTVWKPISDALLGTVLGQPPDLAAPKEIDERQRRVAASLASDGARLASEAGLKAEPLVVRTDDAVWEAIEEVARSRRARLIVCGTTRGDGVESLMSGRLPLALLVRSSTPVLVVPSAAPEKSGRRRP